MKYLSCTLIFGMFIMFIFFLARAYMHDKQIYKKQINERGECSSCEAISMQNTDTSQGFHSAVVATVQNERDHGVMSKSRVRHMLTSARDQIIRGAIMGAIGGGPIEALHNALTWSLVGGIVNGCGHLMHWKMS